jgi:light-independent protochlorophyllide reductase subunit B
MGLEEHLLGMFREDFEFNDDARPSHHGPGARIEAPEPTAPTAAASAVPQQAQAPADTEAGETATLQAAAETAGAGAPGWTTDAEKELKKIPFFVRGKVKRNTERFATERGDPEITVETLYDAKAHFSA